jgi:hypothetical protein
MPKHHGIRTNEKNPKKRRKSCLKRKKRILGESTRCKCNQMPMISHEVIYNIKTMIMISFPSPSFFAEGN